MRDLENQVVGDCQLDYQIPDEFSSREEKPQDEIGSEFVLPEGLSRGNHHTIARGPLALHGVPQKDISIYRCYVVSLFC